MINHLHTKLIRFFNFFFLVVVLLEKNTTFYDEFGHETSIVTTGGYALIVCQTSNCKSDTEFQLVGPKGDNTSSGKCVQMADGKYTGVLRLHIGDSFEFGQYYCTYGAEGKSDPLAIMYRICKYLLFYFGALLFIQSPFGVRSFFCN